MNVFRVRRCAMRLSTSVRRRGRGCCVGTFPVLRSRVDVWRRVRLLREGSGECGEDGQDLGGFGADAWVGVGFSEGDGGVLAEDEGGGQGKAVAGLGGALVTDAGVVEGDIDEDAAVVAADGLG